jgi:hypothetical protein
MDVALQMRALLPPPPPLRCAAASARLPAAVDPAVVQWLLRSHARTHHMLPPKNLLSAYSQAGGFLSVSPAYVT